MLCSARDKGVREPAIEAQQFAQSFEANINCVSSVRVTKYCTVIGHTTVQCNTVHEIQAVIISQYRVWLRETKHSL